MTIAAPIRSLTVAQERVAKLVAHGYSYSAIAERLHLSPHTVRYHIRTIALLLDNPDGVSYYNTVLLWATHHLR